MWGSGGKAHVTSELDRGERSVSYSSDCALWGKCLAYEADECAIQSLPMAKSNLCHANLLQVTIQTISTSLHTQFCAPPQSASAAGCCSEVSVECDPVPLHLQTYNTKHPIITCFSREVIISPTFNIFLPDSSIYTVIKKSLCTSWLQYRKLQVMFKAPPTSLQIFIDTHLTLTPSVILNSNYGTMISNSNCLKYFCVVSVL
jgi:hypothetical protein